jgi:hypothetical protein
MKIFILPKNTIIKLIAIPIVLVILQMGISSNNAGAGGYATNGCTCHGVQSSLTILTLTGIPTTGYVLGTTYTLTATVNNSAKTKAGFDIGVNNGTLIAGAGTTVSGSSVTHNGGKIMASGVASWTFQWTAPATGSSTVFTFAGNATNNDGGTSGDAWAKLPFTFNAAVVATAPSISGIATSGITTNSANGSASVNANGASTTITVEYGTTTSYGSTTAATPNPVIGSFNTPITFSFTGTTNTLYHYRIVATNSAGTTNSPDQTFTTLPIIAAPSITNIVTSNISTNSANGSASINANNASTAITVEYGTTTSYGSTTTATPNSATGNAATPITYAFSGLLPNTVYHYRINAVNSLGTSNSTDQTFTTLSIIAAPSISNIVTSGITFNSANGSATINANNATTAIIVEYGTTISYGSTTVATPNSVPGNTNTPITYAFSSLLPNTLYHYKIKATNSFGVTNSTDQIFTTLSTAIVNVNQIPIQVYPNPSTNMLSIDVDGARQYTVKLFAINGAEIATQPSFTANKISLPTSGIANGNYILHLQSKANTINYPIVIKH